jgi:hypothetical protein
MRSIVILVLSLSMAMLVGAQTTESLNSRLSDALARMGNKDLSSREKAFDDLMTLVSKEDSQGEKLVPQRSEVSRVSFLNTLSKQTRGRRRVQACQTNRGKHCTLVPVESVISGLHSHLNVQRRSQHLSRELVPCGWIEGFTVTFDDLFEVAAEVSVESDGASMSLG